MHEAQLSVKLTDQVNLNLKLLVKHDNRPPLEVKTTDISYRTALEYRF